MSFLQAPWLLFKEEGEKMSTININHSSDNFGEVIDRVIARIIEIQQIIKPDKIDIRNRGDGNAKRDW